MNARTFRRPMSPVAVAVLAALAASPAARAQQTGTTAGGLEEIIVTAQKREQNLQEVPVAVSVLGGDLIDRSAAYNIEGLNALVPSLNFRKGGTTINSTLFLRGVGTVNFSLAAEPSVSTVLDGVVLARAGEAFADLNDIERIEVLRGPQGTLFGKNASAGVVNIVSRMPTDEFGATADVSFFEGSEYKIRGTLNVPISESVSTRVTAFVGEYDGNIRNLFDGQDINGYDRKGVRGIALIEPSDDLRITLIGDWRQADDDCCGEVIATAPNNAAHRSLLSGVNFAGDETREVRHNLVTRTEETAWGLSGQVDWDVGEHTLTSITAYRVWDAGEIREGDWLDRTAAYVGNAYAQLHDNGPQTGNTFSQEFRLASPTGQFLDYVVGLFYFDASTDRSFTRDTIVCASTTLPPDATGLAPCAPGSSTFTNPRSSAKFGSDSLNMSAFGEGTINFSDAWRAILGLRYTDDELSYYHDRVPSPIPGPGVRTDTSGYEDKVTDNAFSGRAALQWDISGDLMSYVSYSRGYKGPAFNVFFNMNPSSLNPLESETADAYEAGLKATLFGGSTILNFALFYANYDNFQANSFDTLNGVVITRLTNAGEISTKGIELDFLSRPIEGLSLSGGIAYTDAQIESFNVPPNSPPSATDRSGERLPFAPEWKGSLNADYQWNLTSSLDMFLNGTISYTSSQYTDLPGTPGPNPLVEVDAYTLVDAAVGVAATTGAWRVALLGKNLTDDSYATLITPGGPGASMRYLIPREADRYFGVQATIRVGGER